ncbi:hypothetical protein OG552_16695 [Streptomyces sp. NBC_01476]|uniref:hypothetical protein n=1 Tax=Streptomyces sp. NBC_01476 TaxID=2903881 RepID=UPI002E32825A|nr:hypothetical protein [Streptomyces sp. NBC_01476]
MTRPALLRVSATLAVLCATVSGLGALSTGAAYADPPTETVVPPTPSGTPPPDLVVFAGPGGFLHHVGGQAAYVWTKFSGGDVPVAGIPAGGVGQSGADADIVSTSVTGGVQLQDMDTGTTTVVKPPTGDQFLGTFGSHVLTYTRAANGSVGTLHILGTADGQQTQLSATGWPAGVSVATRAAAGDADTVLMRYSDASGTGLALVDLDTGRVTPVFSGLTSIFKVVLTDKYVGWYNTSSPAVLHLRDRSDPGAAETTVPVPAPPLPSGALATVFQLAIAGNSVLADDDVDYSQGTPPAGSQLGSTLYQFPLSGGPLTTLVGHVASATLQQESDRVLVVGGSSAADWAARVLTAGADGTAVATVVHPEPALPESVTGLAVARGRLYTIENADSGAQSLATRTVTWGATPSYGARTEIGTPAAVSDCSTQDTCAPPLATGDGGISQLARTTGPSGDEVTVQRGAAADYTVVPALASGAGTGALTGGSLVDSDGSWVVYDSADGRQFIGTSPAAGMAGNVRLIRQTTGAALSGSYLWASDGAAGALSRIDLNTGQTLQTVDTGAPCAPTELQSAVDRWIYWSCGAAGPAGVLDLTTGKDIAVPSGAAQLGDGYLVRHDTAAGKLELTDIHTGAAVTTDLATLPAGPVPDDRRVTWTVDKYSGGIAYVDAQNNVHLVDPHIPASAALPGAGQSLLPGERITAGHSVSSASATLTVRSDGNLVETLRTGGGASGPVIWTSGSSGHPGAYAVLQSDGNLVVYAAGGGAATGGALWSSRTYGHPGAYAVLQDDGGLAVQLPGGGGVAWSSGSAARPQTIASGTLLKPYGWTQGRYTLLVMQADGNFVMYRKRDGKAIWSTGTYGHAGAYADMQSDGNLVVYGPGGGPSTGGALWSTGTYGHAGAYADMQDDGNLVVYRAGGGTSTGGALWSTGTYHTAP